MSTLYIQHGKEGAYYSYYSSNKSNEQSLRGRYRCAAEMFYRIKTEAAAHIKRGGRVVYVNCSPLIVEGVA